MCRIDPGEYHIPHIALRLKPCFSDVLVKSLSFFHDEYFLRCADMVDLPVLPPYSSMPFCPIPLEEEHTPHRCLYWSELVLLKLFNVVSTSVCTIKMKPFKPGGFLLDCFQAFVQYLAVILVQRIC